MPQLTENLPTSPSELTASWLSAKLGHAIKSIEKTNIIWGTNSKLFFTLTYEDASVAATSDTPRPTYICIKGMFDPSLASALPWTITLAQREAQFYTDMAPHISGTIAYPKCWWAGWNEHQGISIMSDLVKEDGCAMPPEQPAYSVDLVKDGVRQLAGLHAQYWGKNPDDFEYGYDSTAYDEAIAGMSEGWDEIVRQKDRPELPVHLMDGKRCTTALRKWYAERNPRFKTLLHVDPHAGNVYVTAEGGLGFLDWSAHHFASCFHDVTYHVMTMLTVEDRRKYEMEILDCYLEELCGKGGPKLNRSDPEVMVEYKRSFMSNTVWLVCPTSLQGKERLGVLAERTVAAWEDHGVIDAVLGYEPKKVTG